MFFKLVKHVADIRSDNNDKQAKQFRGKKQMCQ